MANPKRIRITQVKSIAGALQNQKACVRGLGLRRIRHSVDVEDTPSVRGMIRKADHLVRIEKEFWDFTRLSEAELLRVRRLGRALSEMPMGYATPIYFADLSRPANEKGNINNGTGTLFRIDGNQFCVTAQHVIAAYRIRHANNPKITFQIGNAIVDPEKILVDESERLDLVVFNMNEFSAADLAIEGEIPTSFVEVKNWPLKLPELESFVMYGGYPLGRRIATRQEVEWQSMSSGAAFVHNVSAQNIVCRIETDMAEMEKTGIPAVEIPDLGGLSGGPVLQEKITLSGVITLELVGFIYEYEDNFDALLIRPATCLNKDGTIDDPSRWP